MTVSPRRVATIAACSSLLFAHRGQAQDTEAAATALFDDGRKLMAQRHYAEACPKLAESERLAPSGGTLINLAECYEHTGQTASAWAAWKEAAARANAAGKASAEKNALARAVALEPTLAKLTIVVSADSDVAGLQVKRDGVSVGHSEFGAALPVDPGAHIVEATAPRKKSWSTKVDVSPRQTDARVTVALADDVETATTPIPSSAATGGQPPAPGPANAVAPVEQPGRASGWSAQRTIGVVAAGAGVVGLAVGSVFGIVAKSKNDEALQPSNCRTPKLCTPTGLALTNDASNAATASTIAFAVGGAAVAAGAVLWLTAPRASTMGIRATPAIARSYGGFTIDAAW